jgi:hypothetical protein
MNPINVRVRLDLPDCDAKLKFANQIAVIQMATAIEQQISAFAMKIMEAMIARKQFELIQSRSTKFSAH